MLTRGRFPLRICALAVMLRRRGMGASVVVRFRICLKRQLQIHMVQAHDPLYLANRRSSQNAHLEVVEGFTDDAVSHVALAQIL